MRISDWRSDFGSFDLKSVGQCARYRLAIEAAHLLEIGELRHFHAVAPDFPAKTPGAKRRRFPVIFGKANVVEQRINPDFRKAAEIQFLQIGRGWLHDHLILVIMLQAIGLRSEEHTSELQSLMRSSYAVFCLNKKTNIIYKTTTIQQPKQ